MSTPLVLIHGYSDTSKGLKQWRIVLIQKKNLDPSKVHPINHTSLANEVSIRDIADAINRALLHGAGISENEPFVPSSIEPECWLFEPG